MFGIILLECADHLAQGRLRQAFGIIRVGSQSGKTCRQAERLDFIGIKRGQIQGNQSAQRPAENVCRRVDLSGEGFGNGGNIKRFGKRRIAVSGQIKRADVPIGRQARYQIVEYMAVRRPTVYQINFFSGVWHECSFLVAQFETAQCATLRIMPRFRFRRPLQRLRKRFDGIFYRRSTKLPFVFPPCRGRGGVRQLSEKAARI